jgi:hypothetical protein
MLMRILFYLMLGAFAQLLYKDGYLPPLTSFKPPLSGVEWYIIFWAVATLIEVAIP